jgi:hypothetical protein
MKKDDFNIDERILQLEASKIYEKQELMHVFNGAVNKLKPLNVLGFTVWEVLKTPTAQGVLMGVAKKLFSRFFVKKEA